MWMSVCVYVPMTINIFVKSLIIRKLIRIILKRRRRRRREHNTQKKYEIHIYVYCIVRWFRISEMAILHECGDKDCMVFLEDLKRSVLSKYGIFGI